MITGRLHPVHSRVVSYQRRGGRLGPQLQSALDEDLPGLLMPTADQWDFDSVFPDCQRVVFEIGSGMGEATVAMARAQPDTGLIAVEVHDRGVAALTRDATAGELGNLRIHVGDAVQALLDHVTPESLDEVRVWFPDPWPKTRHHKRRLVSPEFLDLVVPRLKPTGRVHLATDHSDYANVMREVLSGEPRLAPELVGHPRPPWRPLTKFERAGMAAGRPSHDFIYVRAGGTIATEPLRR